MDAHKHNPELDDFAVIPFETSKAESFWESPDFSLHVKDRSGDIHEFLNTEIHLRTAKHLYLKEVIRRQLQRFIKQEKPPRIPPPPTPAKSEEPSPTSEKAHKESMPGKFVFQRNGRSIEIRVSPEQYQALFSTENPGPSLDQELEQFLRKTPQLKKQAASQVVPPDENIALSLEEDEDLVSETMAHLHMRQGNTGEALRIYQRLCLLFPEKSSYFEAQIQKLKKT